VSEASQLIFFFFFLKVDKLSPNFAKIAQSLQIVSFKENIEPTGSLRNITTRWWYISLFILANDYAVLCPVMDWHPVQGVPRLVPDASWDRLQVPRDPEEGVSGRRWMDGWITQSISGSKA
ncbi:hypothetical protein AMELA_G00261040, partial [Ameiurus melas]